MLMRDLIVAKKATILLHMDVQNYKSEPVLDTLRVKEELMGVCDKRGKVARMIHAGELIQLRRGLYATRRTINPHCLAASIYGPSYISFDTALSFHGLIPEAVYEITSATLKRSQEFENTFGRYRYSAVPKKVYPLGIERRTEGGIPFLIASPTKALCDRIALEPRMRSMSDVRQWAELMRLNDEHTFDPVILKACAENYRRPAVRVLWRTLEKYGGLLT